MNSAGEKMAQNMFIWFRNTLKLDPKINPKDVTRFLNSGEFRKIDEELNNNYERNEDGVYTVNQLISAHKTVIKKKKKGVNESDFKFEFKNVMLRFIKVSSRYVRCNFCWNLVCRCPPCLLTHNHDKMLEKIISDKVTIEVRGKKFEFINGRN